MMSRGFGLQTAYIDKDLIACFAATYACGDVGIECLYTDLQLEAARRELTKPVKQSRGKVSRDRFEMHEDVVRKTGDKKVQDGGGNAQVEGPIHKLKLPCAAFPQIGKGGEDSGFGKSSDCAIAARQAEFATIGATPRRFYVDQAMGDIISVV